MLGLLLVLWVVGCTSRPGSWTEAAAQDVVKYPVGVSIMYPDYEVGCCWNVVAGGGDFNADGNVDLATSVGGENGGLAGVYLGTADGFEPDPATWFNDVESYDTEWIPIAVAGDVNADGYDDVIVAADDAQLIKIYAGSAVGVPADPTWTLREFAGDRSVASVAGAGDVNGDGYDDVIVGVKQADAPGGATVHLGSAAGILDDATNQELASGSTTEDAFGFKVAGAGDVNGDGYEDVIVGGSASFTRVFYGSASGILTTGGTALEAESITYSVAGAGDVNGDGYDDVLVGMGNTEPAGSAALHFGSPGGVDPAPAWTRLGVTSEDLQYGYSVASAGDLNADGYGEVMTAGFHEVDIFLGSPAGLGPDPVTTLPEGGCSTSTAGDVDRDGRGDIVVCGGDVYLASTLLAGDADTDSDSDSDSDADGDTDADSDSAPSGDSDSAPGDSPADSDSDTHLGGCQGDKQGCATLSGARFSAGLGALSIAFLVARRRPLSQD